jgi:hypothetical protein
MKLRCLKDVSTRTMSAGHCLKDFTFPNGFDGNIGKQEIG